MNYSSAAASYSQVQNQAGVEHASPHKLIEMLFDGLMERLAQAKGAMQYNNAELKGKKINGAIAIINGLRENLDRDQGGELAQNLDGLYVYVQNILAKAHQNNDENLIDEAADLIGNIQTAWKEIG